MPKLRVLAFALCCVVAGCKPAATPGTTSTVALADVIAAQLAAKGALRWAKNRPLTAADYRAATPAATGQEGAHTEYTIISGVRCVGRKLDVQVAAAMLPAQSWMIPSQRQATAEAVRTLRHEQTHFDLSEVFARKIRRRFSEMYEPCSQSEAALQAVSDSLIRDEAKEQVRYDEETDHGRREAAQTDWDRQVAAWLESLSQFAR